jgi:TIR domain
VSTQGTPGDEAVAAGERPVTLRVFMSYRRDDASGHAGRLFDELTELPRYDVFMDIEKIDAGLAFKEAIDGALASCDVFLALIGRRWLDAKDSSGRLRLENPGDLVRLEIQGALAREGVRVVPVLIQDVDMPASESLPEPLRGLADRNAHELSDTRWHYDVEQLVEALDAIAAKKAERERARVDEAEREAAEAAEREQAELAALQRAEREAQARERALQEQEERRRREEGGGPLLSRRTKMLAGALAAVALVALAGGGIAMLLGGDEETPPGGARGPEAVGNPEVTVGEPFPYDALNGTGNRPPFGLTFDENDLRAGTIPSDAGFTGLMTDGETPLEDLWDPDAVSLDDGVLQITATKGDPLAQPTRERPAQVNAFQFGVTPADGVFTAHVRLPEPFFDLDSLENFQALGLFIGTGDQDNYVKLVAGSLGIELLGEVEQVRVFRSIVEPGLLDLEAVDLYLTVDPAAETVTASFTVTDGGETGDLVQVETESLPALGSWLGDEDRGLAVGVISTTGRDAPEFAARWDLIEVVPGSP